MSAKTMSENRDLRKQIGCMNGLFQIFDRHHFLTGRRVSSHTNKKLLLQGSQHQLDQKYAAVREKGVEVQKDKPRISTESSRASTSSASCSSTFSSLDYNKTAQPETFSLRQSNVPENNLQTAATKQQLPSLTKDAQSHDLRDIVKDSMYREVRSLSIKSLSNDDRRGPVMKHIDSPRPWQQPKPAKPKSMGYTGSPRVLAKVQEGTKNSKDERLALPRYSYDGRDSREMYKSAMKHKEQPRLSLDSKTGSMKALESRLSFLGRDLHVGSNTSSQVVPLNHEQESHNRTSNIVAKLMGLNAFSHTVSTDESMTPTIKSIPKEAFCSQSTSIPEENKHNQVNFSPRVSQNSPASPSPKMQSTNLVRKVTTSSRFPVEPAPWRRQESSQGSPKMASKMRKPATNTLHQKSSVYGEIEKRITELEFKKSGKDLRALKQILEAMQKTREQLEDRRGEPDEFALQRCCSLEEQNRKTSQQVPTIKSPCTPKQSGTVVIMKPAKVTDKVKRGVSTRVPTAETSHLQRIQTRSPRYKQGSSAQSQKANNLTPENDDVKCHNLRRLPSADNKTSWSTSEQPSPRLRHNLLRIEEQSRPTTPSSDSGRIKKQCSKKVIEKGSQNRKTKVRVKDQQLSDDQLSEISWETRYSIYQGDTASVKSESNNSLLSQTETEIYSMARSIKTDTRPKENSVSTIGEHMPAVESAVTMLEQPSPISVLDSSFYCEDTLSPVKKISVVYRDESPSPDEAEWHLETLTHLRDCTRPRDSCTYDQKLDNMKNSVHSLTLLHNEPDGTATDNGTLDPDHRYINKILLTSGLLKDSSFITTTDQPFFSKHLINPEMFHVLELTEEIRESANGGATAKNDRMNQNKRIQRKMIFDMVDEILVRKITSSRFFTVEKEQISPHGLLKEVHSEMDRVCRIPDCNLPEQDEIRGLISADMTYHSEDWVSYGGEVPALVLGIERMIFRDLINEVVTGELMDLRDLPKSHCRKLFSN